MDWDWLHKEIVPKHWHKYVVAYSGAVIGGIVFALSRSWGWAILYDLITVLSVWATLKLVRAI